MIIGLGVDLCEVDRIAGVLERQGDRFRNRICSKREQALGEAQGEKALFYAGRFAAKEACAKALGTGITERVRWCHIELLADLNGKPVLHLSDGALRRAKRLAGNGEVRAHVSITHDGPFAMAFVVLEAGQSAVSCSVEESRYLGLPPQSTVP
jgi:holo-[acyl-carrier protein] synthase